MMVRKIITKALATVLAFGMTSNILHPNIVYAKESTETVWTEDVSNEFWDDYKTTSTAETADKATFSLDESQMTEEQQSKYMQVLSGGLYELEVGESVVIGSNDEGLISIKCVSASTSLGRASWNTSYKEYNIYITILDIDILLASVDLECTWYKNGIDGYIQNLKGTYTEENDAWHCSWDEFKKALPYNHALWLNLKSMGGTLISVMLAASYSPYDETLSFTMQETK